MKLFIHGKGSVNLDQRDFVAQGGFGSVYAQGQFAYKIYADSKNVIPLSKINELSALDHPNVIKPIDLLVDNRGKPVGYNMRYVADTFTLCQLFPKAFRVRSGLTSDKTLRLAQRLQELVIHCHRHDVTIVDLNELNVLVDETLDDLYLIDVDNFKTKSFPAQGLMESVRDRHAPTDANGVRRYDYHSDYFSLAVVLFNLFIGIHPYKGKHHKYHDMESRMLANCSVLDPEVSYPSGSTIPFGSVPDAYMRWFDAVLQRGLRVAPPDSLNVQANVVVNTTIVISSGQLEIEKLWEYDQDVVSYYHSSSRPSVITTSHAYIGMSAICEARPGMVVIYTPKYDRPLVAWIENHKLKLFDVGASGFVTINLNASKLMVSNGHLYLLSGINIVEMRLIEVANGVVASPVVVANVTERATLMFDGVAVQSLFGSCFVSLFPSSGLHFQSRVRELDDVKVIDAKFCNRVLQVVAVGRDGKYDRFVFRFDEGFKKYDCREVDDVVPQGLNFVVMDSGVCVQVNERSELEIFSNRVGNTNMKVLQDQAIDVDGRLFRRGTGVVLVRGGLVFTMRMK